jgi:hypothetical protein
MIRFRANTMIATLTLLAVAANPVLALSLPCCCTQQAEQAPSCCERVAAETECVPPVAPRHGCCAKHQHATQVDRLDGGCCCVKAAVSIAPARETLAKAEQQLFGLATLPPIVSIRLPSTERRLDIGPLRGLVSGPPLLALHCTWQK